MIKQVRADLETKIWQKRIRAKKLLKRNNKIITFYRINDKKWIKYIEQGNKDGVKMEEELPWNKDGGKGPLKSPLDIQREKEKE